MLTFLQSTGNNKLVFPEQGIKIIDINNGANQDQCAEEKDLQFSVSKVLRCDTSMQIQSFVFPLS